MAPLLAWTVRTLALAALGLSAMLWWSSATTETAVGCDFAAFDCDAALASRWAKWLGVPVAAGGTLCYAAALAGSLLAPRRDAGWRLLEFAAPLALGAAVWFVTIQATQLDAFCLWCVLTHVCGALMAAAAFVWRRAESSGAPTPVAVGIATPTPSVATDPPALGAPTAVAVAGIVALAIGQTLAASPSTVTYEPEIEQSFDIAFAPAATTDPPAPADDEPAEATASLAPERPRRKANGSRVVSLLKGRLRIDAYDHPLLGSPEAPHLVVELMDYACPHCREFHDKLVEGLERFDGQIAVVVMPVPGEKLCNPYVPKARKKSAGACFAAKLALAVARLAPEPFERFHAWMLKKDHIPSRTASLIEAWKTVDRDRLSEALRDDDRLAAQIKQYVEVARAISRQGRYGLPSQILGDRVISGPPKSVDELCEAWADAFGLELPGAPIPF